MSTGLNWFQARAILFAGGAVRRDGWRKWMVWNHYLHQITSSTDSSVPVQVARVVQSYDFGAEEFLANDWTDEPWPGTQPPLPPVVDPKIENPNVPPNLLNETGGSGGGGGYGSGGGGGGNTHHPGTGGTQPTVTISVTAPYAPQCFEQAGSSSSVVNICLMVTAACQGPAGVYLLEVRIGGQLRLSTGYAGSTQDFSFQVNAIPGHTITATGTASVNGVLGTPGSGTFTVPSWCPVGSGDDAIGGDNL